MGRFEFRSSGIELDFAGVKTIVPGTMEYAKKLEEAGHKMVIWGNDPANAKADAEVARDFMLDILDDLLLGGLFLNGLKQVQPVYAVDQRNPAHHLLDFIGLESADEMECRAFVSVFSQLLDHFLNPVFPTAGDACGDGLPHSGGIIHFCGGAEGDLLRIPACPAGGILHLGADTRHIFSNRHKSTSFGFA